MTTLCDNGGAPAATITDVKPLASYSWIEAPAPTIAVPGIPPRWSPPRISRKLPKDSGLVYIAQNAARHPESPLEPLFRALYVADPAFDIRSIDVVTDRNNIRKLLSFVDPSSSRNGLESFTINAEATENTVIFSRVETKTTEIIAPHEIRGFGHEFQKAYTACEIRSSTGHHRIVSYRFSNLSFIVRHEVDGYVESPTGTSSSSKTLEADSLSNLMGTLSLTTNTGTSKATSPAGSKILIREEGRDVPLESTLEMKTRIAHKPLSISDVAPQLWVSQTPKLVRAYHRNGMFRGPQVEDVSADIRRWERGNQANLKMLAALIKKIIAAVKGHGGSAAIKYDNMTDKLVVTKVDTKRMLPKDLYIRWNGRDKLEHV
ncbi:hypothetical protein F4819DRAFT_504158 [Hypoxylon fuscum]|nr:hypothetical protein F4819DRAFT_504158 [Hypoxylon fuscum]